MNKLDDHLNHIQEVTPIMIAISMASLVMGATRLYKNFFTKAARRCSGLSEKESNVCMLHAKINGLEIKIKSLKSSLSKCSKTKNPSKCLESLKNKIKKDELTLIGLKNRYKQLTLNRK